jgi:hypothetical protein
VFLINHLLLRQILLPSTSSVCPWAFNFIRLLQTSLLFSTQHSPLHQIRVWLSILIIFAILGRTHTATYMHSMNEWFINIICKQNSLPGRSQITVSHTPPRSPGVEVIGSDRVIKWIDITIKFMMYSCFIIASISFHSFIWHSFIHTCTASCQPVIIMCNWQQMALQ